MCTAHFVFETVKCRGDVRVRLQVDPLRDVFQVGDLPNHEFLSEVLVVDDKCWVAEDVFNLYATISQLEMNMKNEEHLVRFEIFSKFEIDFESIKNEEWY